MGIQYLDPYKDNKFGKLKGDKRTAFFKVIIGEAKFYRHDNCYVLAGQFLAYTGVDRAYKPELALEAGLCELPIYGNDYEIRQKKAGTGENGTKAEYETIVLSPSINEKLLYQHIEDNPDTYTSEGKAFNGDITFYPDDVYAGMENTEAQTIYALANAKIESIEPSGKYPDWIPPKPYSKGNYNNGKVSLNEKLVFLKIELAETVNDHTIRSDRNLPIAAYIHQILKENNDNERFLVTYFDLMKALVS